MAELRKAFTWVLLGACFLLEMILIASQENKFHNAGHEVGDWGVRMSPHTTSFISWLVALGVGLVFVRLAAQLNFAGLGGMIIAVGLIEFLWGHILPRPQNTWEFAVAFALGALAMLFHVVSETDFASNARQRLQHLWSH